MMTTRRSKRNPLKIDGVDFKSIPVEDFGDGNAMSGESGLGAIGITEAAALSDKVPRTLRMMTTRR